MLRFVLACAVMGSWAPVSDARAQDADVLLEAGVIALQDQQYAAAETHLRAALALEPSPRVAYNLATALVALGRLVEATQLLESLAREAQSGAGFQLTAEARLAEIRPRLPRLTVQLDGDRDGLSVAIDGNRLAAASMGRPVPVDPGRHEVIARDAGGRTVARRDVYVAEARHVRVHLDVFPSAPPPAATVASDALAADRDRPLVDGGEPGDDGGLLSKWWFWAGAGAVALAGGLTAVLILASTGDGREPMVGTAGSVTLGGR